jgi:hypothetical protein
MSASSGKLYDQIQVDMAVLPVSLATTNSTGAYFSLAGFEKVLFEFYAATMAAAATVIGQVYQATSAAGAGSKVITAATSTITANAAAKKVLLTANTIVDETSTVTINGTVFTCEDTTPNAELGEFDSGANDTAACVNLAAVINHLLGATVLATPSTTTVILTAKDPGANSITVTGADSTIVVSTLEHQGHIEVDIADLDATFTHVALKLTTSATIVVAGALIRGEGRYSPRT